MKINSTSALHPLLKLAGVSGILLLILIFLLTGCDTTTERTTSQTDERLTSTSTVPRLLTQLKAEYLVGQGILLPNHQVYFLGNSGVSVVDGLSPVKRIPMPDLTTETGWNLSDISRDPVTGLVYVSDRNASVVQVISGTTVITTISGLLDRPLQLVADEDDGEMYVFYISQRNGSPQSYATVIRETKIVTDVLLPTSSQVARYNPMDGHIYVIGYAFTTDGVRENALLTINNHQVITTIRPLDEPQLAVEDMVVNPKTGDLHILLVNKLLFWDRVNEIRSIDLYDKGYRNLNCLVIDPVRDWTYVCSWMGRPSYTLVVDKDELIAEIPIQHWPDSAAADLKHDYIYIAHYDPTYLSVIRGTELITTLNIIGFGTSNVIVDEERGYIYTANADDGTVSVFGFAEPEPPSLWQQFLPFLQR